MHPHTHGPVPKPGQSFCPALGLILILLDSVRRRLCQASLSYTCGDFSIAVTLTCAGLFDVT